MFFLAEAFRVFARWNDYLQAIRGASGREAVHIGRLPTFKAWDRPTVAPQTS